MSDRCQTRSGPHQCMHGINHDGPCEAQAREYMHFASNRRMALTKDGSIPIPEPKETKNGVTRLTYDLRACPLRVVAEMCRTHHGYGSASSSATYAWAVYEDDEPVAGYAWQPPPFGAARNIAPNAPGAVLALSRMVAVPREHRKLRHVSTPLRRQMRTTIDRGRWPVLVTYSDEGQGHTGHAYKCSGWTPTHRKRARIYLDANGKRASSYSNGQTNGRDLTFSGFTFLQRWEHRVCPSGEEAAWLSFHGWERVALPGRVWRSGNQAHAWRKSA